MCSITDIGGTNARFAIIEEDGFTPHQERTLTCANCRSLVDAALACLDEVSQLVPKTASSAIATPVTKVKPVMTVAGKQEYKSGTMPGAAWPQVALMCRRRLSHDLPMRLIGTPHELQQSPE